MRVRDEPEMGVRDVFPGGRLRAATIEVGNKSLTPISAISGSSLTRISD
jgi:hypothetical protein